MTRSSRPRRQPQRPLPSLMEAAFSIAALPDDPADVVRTKRLITALLWVTIPVSAFSVYQMVVLFDAPEAGIVIGLLAVAILAVLFAMWLEPRTYPHVMHAVSLVTILASAVLVIMTGGILESGISHVWGLIAVLGAVVAFTDHRATLWLVAFLMSIVGSAVIASSVEPIYELPNAEYAAAFNIIATVAFVYFLVFYFVRQRAELLEESDGLLRNILPDAVADRLKTSDDTIAARIEVCSIMFIDIVDFTPMSASMTAEDVVGLLDEVFSLFDDLVLERGLEKIKTIGDAYMVASGVPEPRPDHARILCDLALAISDGVANRTFRGHTVAFRTGINSGPVVAGVIGNHKFSYDLWGDAVNTASRMESQGSTGKIQITEATKTLVEMDYRCEPAGTIEVKGKGPMPVWHLSHQ